MKRKLCLIAVGPLLLAACETEPIVTTTTTETRQEIVRTQGDRVVGREVIVSRNPPPFRSTSKLLPPDQNMSGHEGIGDGPEQITSGCLAAGWLVREQRRSTSKVNGSVVPADGCGCRAVGNKCQVLKYER